MRKRVLLLGLLGLIASAAWAAPETYRLDTERSHVRFTYDLDGRPMTGSIPVTSAEMLIDLERLPTSRVSVTLDARQARAGFFLATEAMRGPGILDTARHPLIRFRSKPIRGSLRDATITGALSIRGVTRTVTLQAGLYRQQGTAPTTPDRLIVLITGEISRAAFGATGYPALVGDSIGLRIVAFIAR